MLGKIYTGPKSFTEPKAIFPHFYTQDIYQSHSTPIYSLKIQTKIPLKSSHNSLCCYKHVLQNVTLAQDVYHRALQGYIAHAEEQSVDETTKQKILALSLQITV